MYRRLCCAGEHNAFEKYHDEPHVFFCVVMIIVSLYLSKYLYTNLCMDQLRTGLIFDQLIWGLTTRNKEQQVGGVSYFEVVSLVPAAQDSTLILVSSDDKAVAVKDKLIEQH